MNKPIHDRHQLSEVDREGDLYDEDAVCSQIRCISVPVFLLLLCLCVKLLLSLHILCVLFMFLYIPDCLANSASLLLHLTSSCKAQSAVPFSCAGQLADEFRVRSHSLAASAVHPGASAVRSRGQCRSHCTESCDLFPCLVTIKHYLHFHPPSPLSAGVASVPIRHYGVP
jgi:hypothetical protein